MDIDATSTIATIVEAMVPRNSGSDGLLIVLDLQVEDYTAEDDQLETEVVHLLILRPSEYTTVYAARCNFPTPHDYNFVGHHDSGWRSMIASVLSDARKDLLSRYDSVYGSGKPTFQASVRYLSRAFAPRDDKTILRIERL